MAQYLLSRLPPADDAGNDAPLRHLLNSSFGAFRARRRGDSDWVESRIASAFSARSEVATSEHEKWLDNVSGLTGVSTGSLREILVTFGDDTQELSTEGAIAKIFDWLGQNPTKLMELMRPENVAGLFGGEFDELPGEKERGEYALPVIVSFLQGWMQGAPLQAIESNYPGGGDQVHCKHARHFVLRLVPDLAFVAGLPARLIAARNLTQGNENPVPIVLATLGGAVREGCNSPESLAVRIMLGRSVSRVAAMARFEKLKPYLKPGPTTETFEETRVRANQALSLLSFVEED
jgi:hypothetical protein